MTNPTPAQHTEMLDILKRTHAWIDGLQISGLNENVIVTSMHMALVERALRAGGVAKTAEWLQGVADMTAALGHELLAEIKRQGR